MVLSRRLRRTEVLGTGCKAALGTRQSHWGHGAYECMPYRPRTRPYFADSSMSVHASTAPQHSGFLRISRQSGAVSLFRLLRHLLRCHLNLT